MVGMFAYQGHEVCLPHKGWGVASQATQITHPQFNSFLGVLFAWPRHREHFAHRKISFDFIFRKQQHAVDWQKRGQPAQFSAGIDDVNLFGLIGMFIKRPEKVSGGLVQQQATYLRQQVLG